MTRLYRFDGFRLDPATRELWRGDAPVAVPPRAFDCIVYLVEHRERAIGRDELIAAVWGKTEITDGMLGQTVLAARRAFDDTGREQHFIRTVVRFGYHWVAATEVVEEPAVRPEPPSVAIARPQPPPSISDSDAGAAAAQPPRARAGAWRGIAVVVAVLIAVLAAFAWHRRATPPAVTGTATHAAIALVLPVVVSSGSGFDWVRLGVMDLIAARLRAAGLPVVPSDNVVALTSAFADRHAGPDAGALAAATGATMVVDARAEHIDARWRVSLRTVHGRDPPLQGVGEAADVLAAARLAADRMARELGYSPVAAQPAEIDQPALAALLQQVEAATLSDHLDTARALLASAPPAERERPEVRLRVALIDYQAGDLDAAEAGFTAITRSVSVEQDRVLHARALSSLGVIAAMRDNGVLAARRFDEAIALLRDQQAPDALGKALNGRANVAAAADQNELALQDFAEARISFESSGNLLALAVLDSNLAALDMHRERYAEAEPVFRRAAARFATFGIKAAELNALTAVAELDVALLEPDAALALEPRLRELFTQVSDPVRQRYGALTRILVLAANGRGQSASEALAPVLDAAARAGDRAAQARGHALAAQLALDRGEPREAASEAAQALQRFNAADDAREHARAYMLHVDALLASGQSAAAAAAGLAAFADRSGSAAARVYAQLARAESSSDAQAAGSAYALALGAADTLRIPLDLREVVRAYARWLIGRGDLARAGALAERVAGSAARDYESALLQLRVHHALGDTALWRSALARVRALAGERVVPAELTVPPAPH
jgi:DNA-binding winged helix-turn-helix (wHTH) protein/tetratricopeptide (TPR) repeat protein